MTPETVQEWLDAARIQNVEGALVAPSDFKLIPAEIFQGPGDLMRGHVALQSVASFVTYVNRQGDDSTAVFADRDSNSIKAILDWSDGKEDHGHGLHSASYSMKLTTDFQRWTGLHGRQIRQIEFAEFVEENLANIASPDAATILETARTLEGKRNVAFKSGVTLANGDVSLKWEEKTDAKAAGDIKVPSEMTLRLPIFRGAENETTYDFRTLFRYRINDGGQLHFEIRILGIEEIMDKAFAEVIAGIRKTLHESIPLFDGMVVSTPIATLATLCK